MSFVADSRQIVVLKTLNLASQSPEVVFRSGEAFLSRLSGDGSASLCSKANPRVSSQRDPERYALDGTFSADECKRPNYESDWVENSTVTSLRQAAAT